MSEGVGDERPPERNAHKSSEGGRTPSSSRHSLSSAESGSFIMDLSQLRSTVEMPRDTVTKQQAAAQTALEAKADSGLNQSFDLASAPSHFTANRSSVANTTTKRVSFAAGFGDMDGGASARDKVQSTIPRVSVHSQSSKPRSSVHSQGSVSLSLVEERNATPPVIPPLQLNLLQNLVPTSEGSTTHPDTNPEQPNRKIRRSSTGLSAFDGYSSQATSEASFDSDGYPRRLLSLAVDDGGLMDDRGEVDLMSARTSQRTTRQSLSIEPPMTWMMSGKASTGCENAPEEGVPKGRHFDHSVWAYYTQGGRWSDGLGAPMQSFGSALCCCCPICWPLRLFLTLRRAVPLAINVACCRCHIRPECALRGACLFTFLCLSMILVPLGFIAALMYPTIKAEFEAYRSVAWKKIASKTEPTVAILGLPCIVGFLVWSGMLAAVGLKYNIRDVKPWPCFYALKSCCCICAMNVRVGLHVDRAQGFREANRYVKQMIRMSEHVRVDGERRAASERRTSSRKSGPSIQSDRRSISAEVLEDDYMMYTTAEYAKVEQHARRISQGRRSWSPLAV